MKEKIIIVILVVFVCFLYLQNKEGDAASTLIGSYEIENYLHNATNVHGDSLTVTATVDTFVFEPYSYNIELMALDGAIKYKIFGTSAMWPQYHRLLENASKTFSVGDLDTLIYTMVLDTCAIQITQSVW
jgi:hypothetical protein